MVASSRAGRPVRGHATRRYFFDASPEHALINPDNLQILVDHVKCAAFELPFSGGDTFGAVDVQEVLAHPARERAGAPLGDPDDPADAGQWHWTSESYPADAISLRSITSDNFVVVDISGGSTVIGETDFTSGPSTCTRRRSTSWKGGSSRWSRSTSRAARPTSASVDCDYYTDRDRLLEGHRARAGDGRWPRWPAHGDVHVSRASSASRRSSSTPTRTWARASSTCPNSRCTPPPTG